MDLGSNFHNIDICSYLVSRIVEWSQIQLSPRLAISRLTRRDPFAHSWPTLSRLRQYLVRTPPSGTWAPYRGLLTSGPPVLALILIATSWSTSAKSLKSQIHSARSRQHQTEDEELREMYLYSKLSISIHIILSRYITIQNYALSKFQNSNIHFVFRQISLIFLEIFKYFRKYY